MARSVAISIKRDAQVEKTAKKLRLLLRLGDNFETREQFDLVQLAEMIETRYRQLMEIHVAATTRLKSFIDESERNDTDDFMLLLDKVLYKPSAPGFARAKTDFSMRMSQRCSTPFKENAT